MKIITFQEGPFLPPFNGVLAHTYAYLKGLANYKFKVTMITNDRGRPDLELYKQVPWKTIFIPTDDYYTNKELISKILVFEEPDIIIINEPEHILSTVAEVAISLKIPVIFETFDITDTTALRQATESTKKKKVDFVDDSYQKSSLVKAAANVVDGITCLTKQTFDKLMLLGIEPTKTRIIKTAVAQNEFTYGSSNLNAKTLLFIGNLYYLPNVLAARTLAKTIYPEVKKLVPDINLLIVGDGPNDLLMELGSLGVNFTGPVEDLIPILQRTTILVSPLIAGNDIKYKLLLALSFGIPCITTSIGFSGFESQSGMIIEDNFSNYPVIIDSLLSNHESLFELSVAGYEMVKTEYNHKRQIDELVKFIQELAQNRESITWSLKRQILEDELSKIDLEVWAERGFRPVWLYEEEKNDRYSGQNNDKNVLVEIDNTIIQEFSHIDDLIK